MQVEFVEGQFDDIEDEEEEENVHEVLSQIMFSKLNTKYKNATQECNEIDFNENDIDDREFISNEEILGSKGANRSFQPKHAEHKYESKINLGMVVRDAHDRKQQNEHATRKKDKSQRATTEQVLDPRTRLILNKMLQRQVLKEIHGCISTGKEANVYHAMTENGDHRALKIYKTSILVFKDREKYMKGEYRWQRYCKGNPRKMVATWAEKELRNLHRLNSAGIPAPVPLELRAHGS